MQIEIIGLPGVGKTYWFLNNKDVLSKYFETFEPEKPTILNYMIALVYRGILSFKVKDDWLLKKLSYRLSRRAFKKFPPNTLFYDSGLLQPVIERFIQNQNIDVVKMLDVISIPDAVIYIEDDIKTIVEREVNRDIRRFSPFVEEELLPRYEAARDIIEKTVLPRINNVYKVTSQNAEEIMKEVFGDA